jgi:UDP-N-acetylmuramoylalanine--D-glutamate ligase
MIDTLLGKNIAIFGLGKSGLSAAETLRRYGTNVIAYDEDVDKCSQASEKGITVKSLMNVDFSKIDFLLWSPGIPHTHPKEHPIAAKAREAGVPLFCDIELFMRVVDNSTWVGISGTNGKSTTTSLLGHILKSSGEDCEVGGNIGVPVFAMQGEGFDTKKASYKTYVLELSRYQLELTPSLDLDVAILLNITPDHLTRHGGMQGYVDAKKSLFSGNKKKICIISIDDEYCQKIYQELKTRSNVKAIPISIKNKPEGGYFVKKDILYDNTGDTPVEIMNLEGLERLRGDHNAQNIMACYAAAKALKVAPSKIISAIESFEGLAHRQELVDEIDGVQYINDSKATNADATEKALSCFDEIYLILGGLPKEDGILSLLPYLPKIKRVFLIGKAQEEFFKVLDKKISKLYKCNTLDKALYMASNYAKSDLQKRAVVRPVVLLSPACASFDQFANFEQRGDVFKEMVKNLPRNCGPELLEDEKTSWQKNIVLNLVLLGCIGLGIAFFMYANSKLDSLRTVNVAKG